jgi:outer membrane protein TolC
LKEVDLQRDLQTVEVTRFALRERINKYIVGIILLREQSKLFGFTLEDLATRKGNVEAAVEFGVMLPSEITKMEVKELEIKAQENNLDYKLDGLVRSLSDLLGVPLARDVEFKLPEFPESDLLPNINRPETKMFQVQRKAILARSDLLEVALQPKLSAYAQAGLGYPNPLNILDNGIAPFGIIGLQLNWQITDWKKNKVERDVLSLQASKLENAEETFEFNMRSKEANYLSEVNRLKAQIEFDKDIADLQGAILEQLAAQLDEGVITSADYVSQTNAELIARQNLLVNQTELLKTQLEFWNDRGVF